MLAGEYDTMVVIFYENNDCIIKYKNCYSDGREESRNWYVNKDTLILPGSYDNRVMRFPAYKYYLKDENLLYLDFINYPFVDKGNSTTEGPLCPLGNTTNLTYKKLEKE